MLMVTQKHRTKDVAKETNKNDNKKRNGLLQNK